MNQLMKWICVLAMCLIPTSDVARLAENDAPNIVHINADDLGYGDLGYYEAT